MTSTLKMHSISCVISCLFVAVFTSLVSCSPKQHDSEPMTLVTHLDLAENGKIPAFVITRLEQGLRPEDFANSDPLEQRVPVVVASAKISEKEGSESRVHFAVQNRTRKFSPKRVTTSPSPIEETYPTDSTATDNPTTTVLTSIADESSSESSSQNSYSKTMSPGEPKIPLLVPVRTSSSSGNNYRQRPTSYVPSDVYTIESSMKYRPRKLHSNSIFYQKSLSFLKQYKNVLVQKRPQGPTYRPNSDTDSPQHVVSAYGEIPPVVYASHDTPYVPESSSTSNSYSHPSSSHLRDPSPIPAPITEDSYDVGQMNGQDVLPIQGDDKKIIGYLPVITLPRRSQLYLPASVPTRMTSPSGTKGSSNETKGSRVGSSSTRNPYSSNAASLMSPKKYSTSLLSPSLRVRAKNNRGNSYSRQSYRSMSSSLSDPYASSASSQSHHFRERFVPLLRISIKPSSQYK